MFGINSGEFLILLLVTVIVVGPERLPSFAQQLRRFVQQAKYYLTAAKSRVDAELGDELADIDWAKLDPRQYDPRRIVREALWEEDPVLRGSVVGGPASASRPSTVSTAAHNLLAPFDDEAT